MAAARVRQARALAGVAESAESLQIKGDASLKRHNWPTDQFYGPGDLANSTTWDNNAALGGGLEAGRDVPADVKIQPSKTPAALAVFDH